MKIRRLLATIVLVIGVMLGLNACDNRPCLRGHYDYMPEVAGKSVIVVPVWDCDVYGSPANNN